MNSVDMSPLFPSFESGVALFNGGQFFEAHEVFEDIWRSAPPESPVRTHLQGIVQIAVALHHYSTGNFVGAASVLARALHNINGAEQTLHKIDFANLQLGLESWQRYLDVVLQTPGPDRASTPPPELPKIVYLPSSPLAFSAC